MGFFDRDPNFGEKFKKGDRFIVTKAEDGGQISTVHGTAERCYLTVVTRDKQEEVRYQALGMGLAEQARKAESKDFPCVVELQEVPTGKGDNVVKKLAPVLVDPREFLNGNDGPPAVETSTPSGSKDLSF